VTLIDAVIHYSYTSFHTNELFYGAALLLRVDLIAKAPLRYSPKADRL